MAKSDFINYRVTSFKIDVNSGEIQLTGKQYLKRKRLLSEADEKKGIYKILWPIEFVKDEIFGYKGELNKDVLKNVVEDKNAIFGYDGDAFRRVKTGDVNDNPKVNTVKNIVETE